MNQSIQKEPIAVTCSDGVVLKGVLLIPDVPKAVVQFNGGTATKKEFYLPFLEYLATQGFLCCLWDYRDSGESAPATLKNCTYRFIDYGLKDMSAIKNYLCNRYSTLPFLIVGHSVGGQQVGFMEDLSGITGMLACAVSTGYLSHMPLSYRLLSNYFFFVFTPVSIALSGYVAAGRFGYMEDLPKEVIKEWRNWCMKPDYFFNSKFYGKTIPEGKFQAYEFPVHLYWTDDDPISNEKSVPSFWNNVKSSAGITIQKLSPADYGQRHIGHHGFFRKRLKTKLWPQFADKLESFIS